MESKLYSTIECLANKYAFDADEAFKLLEKKGRLDDIRSKEDRGNNIDNRIREYMNYMKHKSITDHVTSLRSHFPKLVDWSDEDIIKVYNYNNSHAQSNRCTNGGVLEKFTEGILSDNNIMFSRQVPINKHGIIDVTKTDNKIIDIVFGNPVVGDHISNYRILSLKTSSRERVSEDDWTKVHKPKLYLFGTLGTDYPTPEKFEESDTRKMLCANPRKRDTRVFKLGFNDLVDLIRE